MYLPVPRSVSPAPPSPSERLQPQTICQSSPGNHVVVGIAVLTCGLAPPVPARVPAGWGGGQKRSSSAASVGGPHHEANCHRIRPLYADAAAVGPLVNHNPIHRRPLPAAAVVVGAAPGTIHPNRHRPRPAAAAAVRGPPEANHHPTHHRLLLAAAVAERRDRRRPGHAAEDHHRRPTRHLARTPRPMRPSRLALLRWRWR